MKLFSWITVSDALRISVYKLQSQNNKLIYFYLCFSGEALVVVVSRRRSEPLLSFCQLGPLYISDNTDDGKKDYEAFFPEEEEESGEELLPEEPEKTSTLHVTIPQCGENEDQVSEYMCETAATLAPEYDEVSGLPATSDKVRSLEVEKAEMPTEVVAKVEG